jgi:hypothetical protein
MTTWPTRNKAVESDLGGFGYGRIEYYEEYGDRSTLEITFNHDNNSDYPQQTMTIIGSIEIDEFFKLIDLVRRTKEEIAADHAELERLTAAIAKGG